MINIILLLSIFPAILLRGFVLTKLWTWFIVPFGIVAINIPTAIGISIIAAYLTHQISKDDMTDEDKIKAIIILLTHPLWFLLYGWIIQLFM